MYYLRCSKTPNIKITTQNTIQIFYPSWFSCLMAISNEKNIVAKSNQMMVSQDETLQHTPSCLNWQHEQH